MRGHLQRLNKDGSVITWEIKMEAETQVGTKENLETGVTDIFATSHAFAALKKMDHW